METTVAPTRSRTSWGAIAAGVVVAIGVMLLLLNLGLAVGTTAIDPQAANPFAGVGIGTAIWLGLSGIASLFVGGFVAGRLSSLLTKSDGGLNGVVVWALFLMAGLFVTGSGVAGIVGGTATLASKGGQAAAGSADRGIVEDVLERSGLLDEPTEQTTQVPEAAPAPEGQQQEPGLTRDDAISIIAQNTGLSRQEAENLVQRGEGAVSGVDIEQEARSIGSTVADVSAVALWSSFIFFALLLASAYVGGMVGVRSKRSERVTI